jgi:hypothetical protein
MKKSKFVIDLTPGPSPFWRGERLAVIVGDCEANYP